MSLVIDPESRFNCSLCAACCDNAWSVLVSPEKRAEIEAVWDQDAFEKGPGSLSRIKKQPSTERCHFLGTDNLCELHRQFGESTKPKMCQRFPFLHVASDEHVWVTASYGCNAVSADHGEPLETHRASIQRLFAKDLEEADAGADTVYPLRDGMDWTTPQLDRALDDLPEEGLFATMDALAKLAWDTPATGESEGDFRYALALTLYSDLVDAGFWGRLKGVFSLPQALSFNLKYESKLIGSAVDMSAVKAHPGDLPPEGDALLARWLRSRVRSRRVFRNVPHAAAGITRLLIQANVVLFYARALGDPIEAGHVLHALRVVEQYVANQEVVSTLSRLDPRLRAAWENPQVAWQATAWFRSSSQQ